MNKTLICLGMHRSGTSLVANWLVKCGVNMGDSLYQGDLYNKNGYFEDLDFIKVHEKIFRANDIPQGGLKKISNMHLDDFAVKSIAELITNKNIAHQQWGWKDPRTCLFLNIYNKLVPKAVYFIVFRDFDFVVDSLIRRQKSGIKLWYKKQSFLFKLKNILTLRKKLSAVYQLADEYLKSWITYNSNIVNFVNTISSDRYIVVSYKDIFSQEERIISTLKKWNLEIDDVRFDTIFKRELMNETKPKLAFDPNLELEAKKMLGKLNQLSSQVTI